MTDIAHGLRSVATYGGSETIEILGYNYVQGSSFYPFEIFQQGLSMVEYRVLGVANNALLTYKKAGTYMSDVLSLGYQFFVAEIYTITLASGAIIRLTSADGDIVHLGNTYSVGTVRIQRGDITTAVGVEVSDVEVTLLCNADSQINGVAAQLFAKNGGFDGALIKIELLVMPTYGDVSAGAIHLFEGIVTDCKPDLAKVALTVSAHTILLNAMAPKKVYQPTCVHTLFDSQCTLTKASFTVSSSVSAGSSTTQLLCGLAQAATYFAMGTLSFTSGANAGASRVVRTYAPGTVNLAYPLDNAPATGDTFTITPGCDKLRTTCAAKFSNEANFLAWEYMPVPETSA
jgi:uncharacterized phage protein (TIGR02218 family)